MAVEKPGLSKWDFQNIRTNSEYRPVSKCIHFIGDMSFINWIKKFKKEVCQAVNEHPFWEVA